jgi:hypothetical protein
MNTINKLGIWMDHSNAHTIEYSSGEMESKAIASDFIHEEKTKSLGKSENLMHNKEQHQQSAFYKNLIEVIGNYHEVLLFGPTNAKEELLNLIRADHRFEKIIIEVRQADKMTDNQQHAYVKSYFENKNKSASE